MKVDGLITGAVLRSGDRVRVTAQLIDPATEAQIWANSYERDLRDVLSLQNEIVSAITREVNVRLTPQDETRLASARQVIRRPMTPVLKGGIHGTSSAGKASTARSSISRWPWRKTRSTLRPMPGSRSSGRGTCSRDSFSPSEATPKVKAAALKALELDNTLAEVHFVLAAISAWVDWDWLGAERAFRRAIELNPSYPEPRIYYAHYLNIMGRSKEAAPEADRALELDPLNALFQGLYAMHLMCLRRYDDAVALLRKILDTAPNDAIALSTLRSAYHMKRMYKEALEIWKASYAAKGDHEAEEALARGFEEGGYQGALRRVAETLGGAVTDEICHALADRDALHAGRDEQRSPRLAGKSLRDAGPQHALHQRGPDLRRPAERAAFSGHPPADEALNRIMANNGDTNNGDRISIPQFRQR